MSFNSDPTSKINNVAKAIAFAEGCIFRDESYNTNSLAYKHNNPCDLKHAPDGYHAMADGSAHGILRFISLGDGWNAGFRQVELITTGKSDVYNPHMTFTEIAEKYAMENDTPKERFAAEGWAKNVESFLGITADTTIGNYVNGTANPIKVGQAGQVTKQPEPTQGTGVNAVTKVAPVQPVKPVSVQPDMTLKNPVTPIQGTNVTTTTKVTPAVPSTSTAQPTKEKDDVK